MRHTTTTLSFAVVAAFMANAMAYETVVVLKDALHVFGIRRIRGPSFATLRGPRCSSPWGRALVRGGC